MNDFYSLIRALKKAKRQGWIDKKLQADSIADHTYGAMVLGWVISSDEKVDANKVVQMLLVHDLVMAKMEDVTPNSGKYSDKRQLEERAKLLVKKLVPNELQQTYINLFDEFNEQETKEAKLAREVDKLETLLQGEAFEIEENRSDILDEFLQTYKDIFKSKKGRELYEQIKERHNTRK